MGHRSSIGQGKRQQLMTPAPCLGALTDQRTGKKGRALLGLGSGIAQEMSSQLAQKQQCPSLDGLAKQRPLAHTCQPEHPDVVNPQNLCLLEHPQVINSLHLPANRQTIRQHIPVAHCSGWVSVNRAPSVASQEKQSLGSGFKGPQMAAPRATSKCSKSHPLECDT